MHESLKKLLSYQNQSLKAEKSAKTRFPIDFNLDLYIFLVHLYFPQILFWRSCDSLVLINKKFKPKYASTFYFFSKITSNE